jgi:hypothetical protein
MRLLPSYLLPLVALGCGASATEFRGAGGGTTTSTYSTTSGTTTITTTSFTTGTGGSTSSSSGSHGGSTSTSSSSSSSSASTSGTGGGLPTIHGDCHLDSECASGKCVPVTPGGFLVCVVTPVKATTCNTSLDQCCPTQKPCANNAQCLVGPLVPVCTGLPQPPHNQCAVDQCMKDVDCAPGQICALAGTLALEIRACVDAHCKVDTDCTAHPGGICAPVVEPCCGTTAGLFCVYPQSGGCRKNADCTAQPGTYCAPDPTSGTASCQAGAPICPA